MSIIYNNGEFDLSDDGQQAKDLNKSINIKVRIDKLPREIRKIAELIRTGYNYKEIAKKLKTTEGAIKMKLKRYRRYFLDTKSV